MQATDVNIESDQKWTRVDQRNGQTSHPFKLKIFRQIGPLSATFPCFIVFLFLMNTL